jgi:hypothetical protein
MTNASAEPQAAAGTGQAPSMQKVAFGIAAGVGTVIVVIFLIGLLLVLFTPDVVATAARMQYFRDIVLIVVLLQGVIIIAALATLVVQISRLILLLRQESAPVLQDAQEVVRTTKQTASFVSKQVAQPLVQFGGFMAGLGILLRDIGGIRRAIRTEPPEEKPDHEAT